MKWFKHYSDSHSNLKLQQVIAQFGVEGYGFFWICDEIVAQQGTKFRIKAEKNWKKSLSYFTRISEEKAEELYNFFSSIGLIDKKAYEMGDLYIPKLAEYGDEYTDKVRRMSRHNRDNVVLDKNRLDKNRLDKNIVSELFEKFWAAYPRKIAKYKAQKSWDKLELTQDLYTQIVQGLEKSKKMKQWKDPEFIPHAATWLNQERWKDEPTTTQKNSQPGKFDHLR